MPKALSSDLFFLIHALSKSEKRFFKLFMARTTTKDEMKIILLFEEIEKQKKYDEEKILKRQNTFSRTQLPNLKVHLYQQILKSLNSLNVRHEIDLKIHALISQAQILYNKCLYHQSLKILGKAKKLAIENDKNVLLLDILELEKLIMLHTVSVRTRDKIFEITNASNKISRSIRRTDTFSNLSLRMNAFYMNSGFVRNKKDFEKVREFFFSSLPSYTEKKLSFHEKMYLYLCYTGYFFYIQDFKKGYFYAQRMHALFDEYPEMILNKIEFYIKSINNLLVAQNKLFLFEEFTQTHKKLYGIKRFPSGFLNENINLNLFKAIYLHEINRHFMMGEFKRGTRIVSKLEKELERFIPILDEHTVLIFYYKIACLYFGAGNFKQSAKWLNKIINSQEGGLREDLHAFARIILLICHYELGNIELLDYSIRSTYRFLLQKGDMHKYQQYIIKFLKSLHMNISAKELLKKFERLYHQLSPLEKQVYEKRPFLYFDIISWLESKISGISVETIIRNKFLKRLPH